MSYLPGLSPWAISLSYLRDRPQAGKQLELSPMGKWWAAVPRTSWPEVHIGSIEPSPCTLYPVP